MNAIAPDHALPPRRVARVHPSFWTGARTHREAACLEAIERGDQPNALYHQIQAATYSRLEGQGHTSPTEF